MQTYALFTGPVCKGYVSGWHNLSLCLHNQAYTLNTLHLQLCLQWYFEHNYTCKTKVYVWMFV